MSNLRHCPHCHCSIVIKFEVQNNKQRYRCQKCRRTWQTHSQPQRLYKLIWHDYFMEDFKIKQISKKYGFSVNKVKKIIASYLSPPIVAHGQHDVVGMDCTYFGRRNIDEWGLLIIVDLHSGECLYCEEIPGHETWAHYCQALDTLAGFGVHPKVCVIDGVPGLAGVLALRGIAVQHCQFHQVKTVNGYLTRNPVLEPNIKLRKIALSLTRVNRRTFKTLFDQWFYQNRVWLNEKTYNPETRKLEWTHPKTRSAVRSLQSNFKYLYTFEQYPELNIPNTNNMLEGINSAIKLKLNRHRGAKKQLKTQLVRVYLSNRTEV